MVKIEKLKHAEARKAKEDAERKEKKVRSREGDYVEHSQMTKVFRKEASPESFASNVSSTESESQPDESDDDEEEQQQQKVDKEQQNNTQLYGKDCELEKMVLLRGDIFCRSSYYDMAIGSAYRASHLARRLLEGVFLKDALLTSTLSGNPAKSQGEERRKEKVKNAIIEFSISYARRRRWVPQNIIDISRALSQKIAELKRQHKKLNLSQLQDIEIESILS